MLKADIVSVRNMITVLYVSFSLYLMLQHIFKNFEILNMLVYSRNTLISLGNCHKTFKFFTQSHGLVVRPVSSEVRQIYSLLPARGQRGGSHLKDHRPKKDSAIVW